MLSMTHINELGDLKNLKFQKSIQVAVVQSFTQLYSKTYFVQQFLSFSNVPHKCLRCRLCHIDTHTFYHKWKTMAKWETWNVINQTTVYQSSFNSPLFIHLNVYFSNIHFKSKTTTKGKIIETYSKYLMKSLIFF